MALTCSTAGAMASKSASDAFTLSSFEAENLRPDKRREATILSSTRTLGMYGFSKSRKYKTGSRKQDVK